MARRLLTARRAVPLLAAIVALACQPTPTVRFPGAVAPAPDRPAALVPDAGESIPWSASRPLTWPDFRARPPATLEVAAVTATSLGWGFRCEGDTFSFQVTAEFHPERSWVNPQIFAVPGSDTQTLRHERLHFDITEVQARRLRQFFGTLSRPCVRSEDEARLGNRFLQEEGETQRRYDAESGHGLNAAGQARWERQIADLLRNLSVYGTR